MCLVVPAERKYLLAKDNILVYKYLTRRNYSYHQQHKYIRYKKQELVNMHKLIFPDYRNNKGYDAINYGYHSRFEIETKKPTMEDNNSLFIIPKGSFYYVGAENPDLDEIILSEIDGLVSDSIIFIGKINWLNKLICKYIYKAKTVTVYE